MWQLRSQKGAEHAIWPYMLALTAFRSQVCGATYRGENDPGTEIWRARQRSGATGLLVMSVLARVYIVEGTRKILTSVVCAPRAGTGVECRQANTPRSALRKLSDMKGYSEFRQ